MDGAQTGCGGQALPAQLRVVHPVPREATSASHRVHLAGALELPARPRPPALLRDGFLPCRDPGEVVPGPAGALCAGHRHFAQRGLEPPAAGAAGSAAPARGHLYLPGGARQPGAAPEPALGDATGQCPQEDADGDRGLCVGLRLPGAGARLLPAQEGVFHFWGKAHCHFLDGNNWLKFVDKGHPQLGVIWAQDIPQSFEVGLSSLEVELSHFQWDGVVLRHHPSLSACGEQSCEGLKCPGLMARTIGKSRGALLAMGMGSARGRGDEQPAPDGTSWAGSQGREEADQEQMLPRGTGLWTGQCPPLHNCLASGNSPGEGPGHSHREGWSFPSLHMGHTWLSCTAGRGRATSQKGPETIRAAHSAPGSTV
ncbi:uncharacterized protein LOC135286390 isoform X1 [Passer domesticus]|uniref:uncharacterized protein LOC135286390 isoform X1 n=1 Tax=Passer domesticus TaxID=48849 RepID=UPI0030FE8ACB